ncbi:hypothetical protein HDE_06149 [Halotydeus destructor]|nr:hypothetical protein HDE_06149 [Halotydeus destructor]
MAGLRLSWTYLFVIFLGVTVHAADDEGKEQFCVQFILTPTDGSTPIRTPCWPQDEAGKPVDVSVGLDKEYRVSSRIVRYKDEIPADLDDLESETVFLVYAITSRQSRDDIVTPTADIDSTTGNTEVMTNSSKTTLDVVSTTSSSSEADSTKTDSDATTGMVTTQAETTTLKYASNATTTPVIWDTTTLLPDTESTSPEVDATTVVPTTDSSETTASSTSTELTTITDEETTEKPTDAPADVTTQPAVPRLDDQAITAVRVLKTMPNKELEVVFNQAVPNKMNLVFVIRDARRAKRAVDGLADFCVRFDLISKTSNISTECIYPNITDSSISGSAEIAVLPNTEYDVQYSIQYPNSTDESKIPETGKMTTLVTKKSVPVKKKKLAVMAWVLGFIVVFCVIAGYFYYDHRKVKPRLVESAVADRNDIPLATLSTAGESPDNPDNTP